MLVASSASPAVTGASPSSPSHWVHCHYGKREPDWARHAVAFLSWRRWRRLTTSDHEPMLRRKDKSQSKQRHAKRMLGSWPCTDALSICQSVNLSTCLCLSHVSLNALPTQSQNCALVLLRWRTQSCRLTSGCCPGAQRPQKGVAFAERSTRSCWVRHRTTACGLQLLFAAAVATKSSSSLMPTRPTFPFVSWTIRLTAPPKLLHLLRFSSIYSNRMVPLSVWEPHTDVDPLSHLEPSDSIKGWHSATQGLFGLAVWPSRGAQRRGAPCPRIPPPVR